MQLSRGQNVNVFMKHLFSVKTLFFGVRTNTNGRTEILCIPHSPPLVSFTRDNSKLVHWNWSCIPVWSICPHLLHYKLNAFQDDQIYNLSHDSRTECQSNRTIDFVSAGRIINAWWSPHRVVCPMFTMDIEFSKSVPGISHGGPVITWCSSLLLLTADFCSPYTCQFSPTAKMMTCLHDRKWALNLTSVTCSWLQSRPTYFSTCTRAEDCWMLLSSSHFVLFCVCVRPMVLHNDLNGVSRLGNLAIYSLTILWLFVSGWGLWPNLESTNPNLCHFFGHLILISLLLSQNRPPSLSVLIVFGCII